MRVTAALLLVLLSVSAVAQEFPEDYTRLLVPLTAHQVSGANGSVWTTELTAYNGNPFEVFVGGPFPFVTLSPPAQDNRVLARETSVARSAANTRTTAGCPSSVNE